MIRTAINNLSRRFECKLKNISEMKSDTFSYGALGYLINGQIHLVAPDRTTYCKKVPKGKPFGRMVEIGGNFASLKTSVIKQTDIPAMVLGEDGIFYFNAQPLTSFQKWLQFELNITPFLQWRDRMFWLDEFASEILCFISEYAPYNISDFSTNISTADKNITVIFRHDVDDSRDLSYLEMTNSHEIPSTYAVLLDRNVKFWLKTLKQYPNTECAYHWASNSVSYFDYLKIGMNKFLKTNFKMENMPHSFRKKSLVDLVEKAEKTGIEAKTIHRHFSFIRYPELINEIEKLSKTEKCMGGSNFSSAVVLKNGLNSANGAGAGFYHVSNDIGCPFWYPFRLYNPMSKKEVEFWDQSCIQEPSSEFMRKMFSKNIKGIKKNIFTISLHPAHAQTKTFRKEGQIETMREIIKMKDEFNLKFMNLKNVYKDMNDEVT